MKLWQKASSEPLNAAVEAFTVGRDYLLDLEILPYDCLASKAHARMLEKIGLLTPNESHDLQAGLDLILELHARGEFSITPQDEDGHTAIENFLTETVGEAGKKIHTGRSRNDQVLTALRLYSKDKLNEINTALSITCQQIEKLIAKAGSIAFPGYTHTRKAMPSSVGLWAGAFRDAFQDDQLMGEAALRLVDQNPLGTGAGYGIPLPLDREMTTTELGFAKTLENPVYAQNSRGKFEGFVISVLIQILTDINKLASDLVFFTLPGLTYFGLPANYLTGSSIMPQKQNPDVLELLRGQIHLVLGYEQQVRNTTLNLISGYHRDMQLTKEAVIRSFAVTLEAVRITALVFENLRVNTDNCAAAMTEELFATEQAYQLVQQGLPFRDAYRQIGRKFSKDDLTEK